MTCDFKRIRVALEVLANHMRRGINFVREFEDIACNHNLYCIYIPVAGRKERIIRAKDGMITGFCGNLYLTCALFKIENELVSEFFSANCARNLYN